MPEPPPSKPSPGATPPDAPKAPVDLRTIFAEERTILAWIRTGLALMGFGFVVARFGLFLRKLAQLRQLHMHVGKGTSLSMYIGVAMVLFGVLVNIAAAYRHGRFTRQARQGQLPQGLRSPLAVVVAIFLALVGVAIAVYLVTISR